MAMQGAGMLIAASTVLLASACTERAADFATSDAWLGEWTGPEGTSLNIVGGAGSYYRITVRNLDGPQTFDGRGIDAGIEFERAGTTEVIRATDGAGTGMKWLADKHNCLVIRPGEGFCRD